MKKYVIPFLLVLVFVLSSCSFRDADGSETFTLYDPETDPVITRQNLFSKPNPRLQRNFQRIRPSPKRYRLPKPNLCLRKLNLIIRPGNTVPRL